VETFSRGTLDPQWVTGFADAAGSFTFSRSGKQLAVYFAVKLANADRPLLEELQTFFDGTGRIYDASATASYFRISKHDELVRVVEHFDSFPLCSSKRAAYAVWREMVMTKQEFRKPDRVRLEELASTLRTLR
jgi:hypothetical protein